MYEQKPWLKFYGQVPHTLEYPRVSMYEAVRLSAAEHLDEPAYDFLGHTSTYRKFMEDIDHCADALAAIGVKKDDRVTISMPTYIPAGHHLFLRRQQIRGGIEHDSPSFPRQGNRVLSKCCQKQICPDA